MKVTINEAKPVLPPKTYTLELSQEEMDLLRDFARPADLPVLLRAARRAANRFLTLTNNCAGNTYKPDVCFKGNK